jgi:adenylosuccinate synthase
LADRPAVAAKLRAVREFKVEQLRDAITSLGGTPRTRQSIETLLDASWIDVAVDNYAWLAAQIQVVTDRAASATIRNGPTVIFEGAQGVLLDERCGFHPHTTWSTSTFGNADALLDEASFRGPRTRLGVLRSYFTRHGAGPLVTEDAALSASLPEPHNDARGWQGHFRVGAFDAVAARYAVAVAGGGGGGGGGVDEVAITHLDHLPSLRPRVCTAYTCDDRLIRDLPVRRPPDLQHQEQLTQQLRRCRPIYEPLDTSDADGFIATLERELNVRVSIASHGPTAGEKRRRIVSL